LQPHFHPGVAAALPFRPAALLQLHLSTMHVQLVGSVAAIPPLVNPASGPPSRVEKSGLRISEVFWSVAFWRPSGLMVLQAPALLRRCGSGPKGQKESPHRLLGEGRFVVPLLGAGSEY